MMNFDFNLKARIQGKDGECGQLAGLVIYPEAQLVTDLIVKRGFLMAQRHVVPIVRVQHTLEDDVYLSISSHELDQYPQYHVVEHEEPVTGLEQRTAEVAAPHGLYGPAEPTIPTQKRKIRKGIASDQRVIESGIPVKNLEGKIGKVVRVVVNRERNEIAYLVVQRGMVFPEYLVVSITMVENVSEDEILVSGATEAVKDLLQYRDVVEMDVLTKQDRLSGELQGMQRDVLQTVVDIQQITSFEEVEDIEIAQEANLDIRLVRSTLDALARHGYVKLEKVKTLSGLAYSAFLTPQGKAILAESQNPIIAKL